MSVRRLLYDVVHPLLNSAAQSRFLIRRLFRVRIPPDVTVHFDPTTVLLRIALQQVVVPQDKSALEVGIGQGALLALGLKRSTHLDVEGVDCSESRVHSSRLVARHNGLVVNFFVSDLFSAVPPDRRYDLIFFNPPYVPTLLGEELKMTRRMRADSDRAWNGGQDGTDVLREFLLRAPAHLSPHGRVAFGVQPIFVPDHGISELVRQTQLAVLNRITRCWIPSIVYVLGHAQPTSPVGQQDAAHDRVTN
jgi:release factor glutamine methyltransferase